MNLPLALNYCPSSYWAKHQRMWKENLEILLYGAVLLTNEFCCMHYFQREWGWRWEELERVKHLSTESKMPTGQASPQSSLQLNLQRHLLPPPHLHGSTLIDPRRTESWGTPLHQLQTQPVGITAMSFHTSVLRSPTPSPLHPRAAGDRQALSAFIHLAAAFWETWDMLPKNPLPPL